MIFGYSERGVFNSIVYYLDANENIIGKFLEILGVNGFAEGKHTFTFLIEQSFSDFGDNDLTIIVDENTSKKTVVFVEGKRGRRFSLKYESEKYLDEGRFSTSNIFVQLYFKNLLSKGKDTVSIENEYLKKVIKRHERKIGNNKVVLNAREKYVKGANQYYYVAIIPKGEDKKTLKEYCIDLALMPDIKDEFLRCAFWQDIEEFFKNENAENVIKNFEYNKGQIF